MLPIGSHILSLISSCDEGVYVCTRLRNRTKAGRDMRNNGNFSLKIFLRNMKKVLADVKFLKILPFVGHCPASFCLRIGRYGTP